MTPESLMLKRATAEMVKGVGGVEAAAEFCRVGKSVLGDNQNINKPDSFVAIDVVACLEPLARERSGWPHVTRALCQRMGGVFVPLPEAMPTGADLMALMARKAKESGDLTAAICAAYADGKLEGHELRSIRGELDQLIEIVVAMREMTLTMEGER